MLNTAAAQAPIPLATAPAARTVGSRVDCTQGDVSGFGAGSLRIIGTAVLTSAP